MRLPGRMQRDERRFYADITSMARSLEIVAMELRYLRELIEDITLRAERPEEPDDDAAD